MRRGAMLIEISIQDRQDPTALKAVTDHRAMEADTRLDTDHKDSISMIGGTGVLGSWKRS